MNVGSIPTQRTLRNALEMSTMTGPRVRKCTLTLSDATAKEDESFVFKHTYGNLMTLDGLRRFFVKDGSETEELVIIVPQPAEYEQASVKAPSSRIVQIVYTDHVSYVIETVVRSGQRFVTQKRYSEFARFHEAFNIGCAELPPKKYFFNMDLAFVKQRRQALQIYIDAVIKNRRSGYKLIDFLSIVKTQ